MITTDCRQKILDFFLITEEERDQHIWKVIWCQTEEETNAVLQAFTDAGFRWASGSRYSTGKEWMGTKADIYLDNRHQYGPREEYENLKHLIGWEKLIVLRPKDLLIEIEIQHELPYWGIYSDPATGPFCVTKA